MDSTRSSVTMMGPVVVGTDGSGHATRAVRWAVGEAAARGRPLRIVYATGTDHGRPYLSQEDGRQIHGFAEGVLDEAVALARRLDPAVSVTTAVCENEAGSMPARRSRFQCHDRRGLPWTRRIRVLAGWFGLAPGGRALPRTGSRRAER